MEKNNEYFSYREIIRDRRMPLAFVDLDKFDRNIEFVAATQENTGKTVRIHSKSVRCLGLLKRIFEVGGAVFQGVMTISVEETAYLSQNGLDNFIVAYPTVQSSDMAMLADMTRNGVQVSLMVDSMDQLAAMSAAGQKAGVKVRACLEIDMAYRPLNTQGIHLGLRRSPVRSVAEAQAFARDSARYEWVTVDSVMGYEGHIAGPNDNVPGQWFKNRLVRGLKRASISEFSKRREQIIQALREQGLDIRIVNGGGSGSLISTGTEPIVTEVTAGSAFYAPGLFHHYRDVTFVPSAFFAIQVVRKPRADMITCQGGGYVASGPAGNDKLPKPMLPVGMQYLPLEGAGEVQTPMLLPSGSPDLKPGDPVFFQHAKGGELSERFNEYLLIKGGEVVDTVKTYRGDGFAFI